MKRTPVTPPWRDAHPCTQCIGREALLCKGQKSKLEHVGSQIYQATARYVEVDGSPYIMEMIQPLDPDSDALSHEDKRLYTDALTGVYNRRFYEDELRHKFLTAGVAMIDLDDFKLCNDTFGHEAGDAALCAVASIIQHNIRSSDMLIRYGGDELLLILPMIPADDFARKLRLINQKLSGARVPGFERLRITSSIGGVLSAGVSIEEAVKLADKRMYQAKRQKNRVVTENEPQNVRQRAESAPPHCPHRGRLPHEPRDPDRDPGQRFPAAGSLGRCPVHEPAQTVRLRDLSGAAGYRDAGYGWL